MLETFYFTLCSVMLAPMALAGATDADRVSFVVLRDTDDASLTRVTTDGKTSVIANGVGGAGLAIDGLGNYIIAARKGLLRVARSGEITRIAEAPAGADWTSVAVEAEGSFILADGRRPDLWRLTKDGLSASKLATYEGLTYDGEVPVAVALDGAGGYLVARFGIEDHRTGAVSVVRCFRVTPDGRWSVVPTKARQTRWTKGITADPEGGFLVAVFPGHMPMEIYHLGPAGVIAKLQDGPSGAIFRTIARNPRDREIIFAPDQSLIRAKLDGSKTASFARFTGLGLTTALIAEADK